jgi:hypothetical protein
MLASMAASGQRREKGNPMRKLLVLSVVTAAFALVVAACGDESQASAEENLCASLSEFAASVVNLQGLTAQTASTDDFQAAADDVREAWDAVKADAENVAEADSSALESAYNDLEGAIEDAPDDVPVADAVTTLQDEIASVAAAYREMYSLNCATGSSSS